MSASFSINVSDNYNHDIMKGQSYLVCNYLEKISEDWKGKKILYKMIDDHVYILPNQVFHRVYIDDKLKMTIDEYVFLGDCF